jgi:hypothetical protein
VTIKSIVDAMDCDCFVGKLCRYKLSASGAYWFLVLERTQDTSFDFPVYRILYEDGKVNESAGFDRARIEEVKL